MEQKAQKGTEKVKPEKWQVLFLPKDTSHSEDANVPSPASTPSTSSSSEGVVAFCPFTKVTAEGSDIQDATTKWTQAAQQKYQTTFSIPRYSRRKVWLGSDEDNNSEEGEEEGAAKETESKDANSNDKNVFVIEYPFEERAVAFQPSSKKSIEGTREELLESSEMRVPSTWMDWNVVCSPLMTSQTTQEEESQLSSSSSVVANEEPSSALPTQVRTKPCTSVYMRPDFCINSPIANRGKPQSAFVRNSFEATEMNSKKESIQWSEDSKRILNTENAGGNSEWSEALSCEMLKCLTGGKLRATECEIQYFPSGGKITDYCMEINGEPIGVSVTRALKFRGRFSKQDATHLLTKKLNGVNQSTRCAMAPNNWNKQILHVWCEKDYVADVLEEAYEELHPDLKSNTLVMATSTINADWVFQNW